MVRSGRLGAGNAQTESEATNEGLCAGYGAGTARSNKDVSQEADLTCQNRPERGADIEIAAKQSKLDVMEELINRLSDYLERVDVVFE